MPTTLRTPCGSTKLLCAGMKRAAQSGRECERRGSRWWRPSRKSGESGGATARSIDIPSWSKRASDHRGLLDNLHAGQRDGLVADRGEHVVPDLARAARGQQSEAAHLLERCRPLRDGIQ